MAAPRLSAGPAHVYIYIPIGIYGGQTKKGQRRKSRYHKSAYMVCASVCAYTSERARGKGHGTSERVHKRGRGEREREREREEYAEAKEEGIVCSGFQA